MNRRDFFGWLSKLLLALPFVKLADAEVLNWENTESLSEISFPSPDDRYLLYLNMNGEERSVPVYSVYSAGSDYTLTIYD